jgi:carboxymethylenebutenolidase
MALAGDLLAALWKEDRNIADPAVLDEIGGRHGVSGSDREKYAAYTQEAVGRGVFGAPSYVYRDEIFWGQDRLDFLERALKR